MGMTFCVTIFEMKTPHAGNPAAPIQALLRSFRAQRPLRAGSLLITVFGDSIAPRGGAVTLGSLIRLAAPFGLAERLVRTSVGRLAREGWLATRRSGRRSEYRLTRSGAARFAEATDRIYGAGPREWDGNWTLVLLPPAAPRQKELREQLRWLGFGQLSPAVLAHPGERARQARAWLAQAGAGDALLLSGISGQLRTDRLLAARGWDLAELARRYRRFLARFARVDDAVATGGALPEETAFLVRTLLIHEYRKVHLQDPLLPPALLPRDWVGESAYGLSRRLYAQVFAGAEAYLSGTARRLHGPLPDVSGAARARFGLHEAP
jgi:phenylacetic acid degradation operon negative regulatory protein